MATIPTKHPIQIPTIAPTLLYEAGAFGGTNTAISCGVLVLPIKMCAIVDH